MVGNIVLTTLLIFILAIPGYIARSFYHTKQLTKSLLPKRLTDDLVSSLTFSLLIHTAAISISEAAFHWWEWVPYGLMPEDINFVVVYRMLTGQFGDNLNQIIEYNVYTKGLIILRYVALVLVLSIAIGFFLRLAVWHGKLDLKLPFVFKFGNYWLYRATGRGIIERDLKELRRKYGLRKVIVTTFVEALVEIEGKFQVYSGMLKDFNIDENGELVDLILTEVQRHSKVREESAITGEARTVYEADNIPGDIFILKCSQIINFNFQYIATSPTSSDPSSTLPDTYFLYDERNYSTV